MIGENSAAWCASANDHLHVSFALRENCEASLKHTHTFIDERETNSFGKSVVCVNKLGDGGQKATEFVAACPMVTFELRIK